MSLSTMSEIETIRSWVATVLGDYRRIDVVVGQVIVGSKKKLAVVAVGGLKSTSTSEDVGFEYSTVATSPQNVTIHPNDDLAKQETLP